MLFRMEDQLPDMAEWLFGILRRTPPPLDRANATTPSMIEYADGVISAEPIYRYYRRDVELYEGTK